MHAVRTSVSVRLTGCPNKNAPLQCFILISVTTWNFEAKIFYGSSAIPYMHVLQFYPWNFCFQILIKFLVVGVGSFMNDLFSTNKLTLKAAGKTDVLTSDL